MKKHDLQPTDDNIRNTFYNDLIGRNKDLVYFIRIIDSINESYSIALEGISKNLCTKARKYNII